MSTRTITNRRGKTLEVSQSDLDAQGDLRALLEERRKAGQQVDGFAASLASTPSPSYEQAWWIHKLLIDARQPVPAASASAPTLDNLCKILRHAADKGLAKPFLRVEKLGVTFESLAMDYTVSGRVLRRDESSGSWRLVAWINVRTGGPIRFLPGRSLTDAEVKLLVEFDRDPAGVGSLLGRRTGNCCFCGLVLTSPESLTTGYGPICADKYGLPWGHVDPRQRAAAVKAAILLEEQGPSPAGPDSSQP